jgi:enediyne biosynthesis protein E4
MARSDREDEDMRSRRAAMFVMALALSAPAVAAASSASKSGAALPRVNVPAVDPGVDSLPARKKRQLEAMAGVRAFHGFRFTDRVRESGIGFVHEAVCDAGKFYKAAHYDHGNGLAAADVDGDGLPDLYFVNQVGGNGLYRNLGKGRFKDVTRSAGVALEDRVSVSAAFADVDGDGDPDLFVTTVRGGNALFRNDGKGRFTDATKEAGLEYVGHSSGALFFDADNDGDLDLFLANVGRYTADEKSHCGVYDALADAFSGHQHPERTEYSILYRNEGGRFSDVTEAAGLRFPSWTGDAGVADLNGDGFQDLYVLNMQGDDHYFESVKGERFVERTAELFPRTPWGTMGIEVFDYDADGRPDILLTDMHSDMSREVGPEKEKLKAEIAWTGAFLQGAENNLFGNALYHNLGDGKFEEVSDAMGAENYWPWGPSADDLNADGYDDVFIASSMNFPFRYGVNTLLLNDGGRKLVDAELVLGVEPRRGGATHTRWFDLDCDTEGEGRPVCAGRRGKVTVMATLGSRSSVILDLDGDGDLDIVTNDFNSAPQVLVSDLSAKKQIRFVKVVLRGSASNRSGLGAAVTVHAGGRSYTKWNDGKSGYLSQSALPLYFGLADAAKIEKIEVAWPSGKKSVLAKPMLGATVTADEPR